MSEIEQVTSYMVDGHTFATEAEAARYLADKAVEADAKAFAREHHNPIDGEAPATGRTITRTINVVMAWEAYRRGVAKEPSA